VTLLLLLNRELVPVSRVKLCFVSVFPDIVKVCPEIFLRFSEEVSIMWAQVRLQKSARRNERGSIQRSSSADRCQHSRSRARWLVELLWRHSTTGRHLAPIRHRADDRRRTCSELHCDHTVPNTRTSYRRRTQTASDPLNHPAAAAISIVTLTLWRPLLSYGYSYKASYARPV